jgi:hypothetical protein
MEDIKNLEAVFRGLPSEARKDLCLEMIRQTTQATLEAACGFVENWRNCYQILKAFDDANSEGSVAENHVP